MALWTWAPSVIPQITLGEARGNSRESRTSVSVLEEFGQLWRHLWQGSGLMADHVVLVRLVPTCRLLSFLFGPPPFRRAGHRLDPPWLGAPVGAAVGLVSGERLRARARLVIVVIAIATMPTSAAVV